MECSKCRILPKKIGELILPNLCDKPKILFLLDYPSIEDANDNKILSGLNKRSAMIHGLIKDAEIDQNIISYASVLGCVTKSKSAILTTDYMDCGSRILNLIEEENIEVVLAFGSIAGRLLINKMIDKIDKVRGKVHDTVIDGTTCIITYAVSILTDTGCGGCNKNIYPFLVRKDIEEVLKPELVKRKLI